MQAALPAMAALTILSASPIQPQLSLFENHSPSLLSSFHGLSLKLKPSSHSLVLAAAAPSKPLSVVAAAKKAVAVLKGTSAVEGVVTLTQDDNGLLPS